jgi:hypothetical protein
MRNYFVRVCRRNSEAEGLVAGIIEDIEAGQKEAFRSFDDLQSPLAHSIEGRQFPSSAGFLPMMDKTS